MSKSMFSFFATGLVVLISMGSMLSLGSCTKYSSNYYYVNCNSRFIQDERKPVLIKLTQGSLKKNINIIAAKFKCKEVVWKGGKDYLWRGSSNISGYYISEILDEVLVGYPLQAVFYSKNNVLVILPRTIVHNG